MNAPTVPQRSTNTLMRWCATGAVAMTLGCAPTQRSVIRAHPEAETSSSVEHEPTNADFQPKTGPDALEALLDPETRLWMAVENLPCEGADDAPLTVVEYVGYQCPFSRRHEATIQRLLTEYDGKVRFCIRQLAIPAEQPFGVLAASTALEVFRQRGPQPFFALHRAMLGAELDEVTIFQLAQAQGIELKELKDSLRSNRYAPVLGRDRAALFALGKSGTPNLFVNGRVVSGARPYEDVMPAFQRALEESERLRAAGLASADVYSFIQRTAIRRVEKQAHRPGEPTRVRIRFIDVPTSKHPLATQTRTVEQARSLANNIVERVRQGEDFGALATEFSAASNKTRGGEFGMIARGTLAEDVEDVAFSLEIGELGVTCSELACGVVQRLE